MRHKATSGDSSDKNNNIDRKIGRINCIFFVQALVADGRSSGFRYLGSLKLREYEGPVE